MLVLTRRVGEEIVIDGNIRVMVVAVKGDRIRLGIIAPPSVPVDRKEVHERRTEFEYEDRALNRYRPRLAMKSTSGAPNSNTSVIGRSPRRFLDLTIHLPLPLLVLRERGEVASLPRLRHEFSNECNW